MIAIDGPSGSGKSSTSRGVARRLGLRYLDTGAQYRALTWWMLEHGVELADTDAIAAASLLPQLASATDPDGYGITVDGRVLVDEIRSPEVDAAVSKVAGVPGYEQLPVARFMTAAPEAVAPTDRLAVALGKMDAGGYRHLPVVLGGRPVGVVSVRDVLRHLTAAFPDG